MIFGPKRSHPVYIFENFFKDFWLGLLAIAFCLWRGDFSALWDNGAILGLVLAAPIARLIIFLTMGISVDEENVIYKRGLLFKSEERMPRSTVTAVQLSQTPINQLTHTYRVRIDNAAGMDEAGGFSITLKAQDAEELKRLLQVRTGGLDGVNLESEKGQARAASAGYPSAVVAPGMEGAGNPAFDPATTIPWQSHVGRLLYKASVGQLLVKGAFQSKGVMILSILALAGGLLPYVETLFEADDEAVAEVATGLTEKVWDLAAQTPLLTMIVALPALFFILSLLAAIYNLLQYYGFEIRDTGDALHIRYGLINRKNFLLPKNKISGLFYEQSLIMRLLHIGILKSHAVGFGGTVEGKTEEPLVAPLIKERDLKETIAAIIPAMAGADGPLVKPEKGHLRFFFYSPAGVFGLLFLAGGIVSAVIVTPSLVAAGLALTLLCVIIAVLSYRHAGILFLKDYCICRYGGFSTTRQYIKNTHLEYVCLRGSMRKRKIGAASLKMGFVGPKSTNTITVPNLPIRTGETAANRLLF